MNKQGLQYGTGNTNLKQIGSYKINSQLIAKKLFINHFYNIAHDTNVRTEYFLY